MTFYAVAVGRKPGVYATWDEARLQVLGFSGAWHKGNFPTRDAANAWIEEERKKIMETKAKLDVSLQNERCHPNMTQVRRHRERREPE